jgi:uncharacterized hydrophobic protein (TIGR00271 family)
MAEKIKPPADPREAFYQHAELKLPVEERDALYGSVLASSHMDPGYLTMLALAGLIALFGLLQNSVAVIIGAMLISPLMNPILSAALALLLGDGKLGRKSAIVLGLSIGGVILITSLVAWLSPLKQVTPEILARTNPNLLDLFIAVLSGLAGTLALRTGAVAMTIIPGVAIAVAVIPPLAVVGYGLSNHHGAMAGGAFLLFLTNLVSIMISAAVVFLLMGFRPHEAAERVRLKLKYRMAISALVLVVLAIPLVQTLRTAVSQVRLRAEVAGLLDNSFKTESSAVTDVSFSQGAQRLQVRATVRTTRYYETSEINSAEESLRKRFGPGAKLTIDQILVTQGGLTREQAARIRDFISGRVVQPEVKEAPFDFKKTQDELLAHLQKQVDEILAGTPLRRAGPLRAEVGANPPVVCRLQLLAPEPLENQTVRLLASQLSAKVSSPLEAHGEVELEGANYTLAMEVGDVRTRLSRENREAVAKLLGVVVSRPDLRMKISVASAHSDAEAIESSVAWREVRALPARVRLKASQWSMEATPTSATAPAEAPKSQGTAAPPGAKPSEPLESREPIRWRFKVYQDF